MLLDHQSRRFRLETLLDFLTHLVVALKSGKQVANGSTNLRLDHQTLQDLTQQPELGLQVHIVLHVALSNGTDTTVLVGSDWNNSLDRRVNGLNVRILVRENLPSAINGDVNDAFNVGFDHDCCCLRLFCGDDSCSGVVFMSFPPRNESPKALSFWGPLRREDHSRNLSPPSSKKVREGHLFV